jgi:hypothetical protein
LNLISGGKYYPGEQRKKNEKGGSRGTYSGDERCIQVGKPEGKRSLGKPKRRCEDDIKMDVTETTWYDAD